MCSITATKFDIICYESMISRVLKWASFSSHCYIFLMGRQSVAANVAEIDRTLTAKPYIQAFTLLGCLYRKKHRNLLIYGALMLFLKAFVKSFVFVSAERQGFEPRVPRGTTVFKTAAIDHSATSPKLF